MSTSLENLIRTDYMPHGVCYQWIPEVLWLNLVADLLIATSYFSIPIALFYFVRQRPDLKFKGLFLLFSLFIALCGATHLISIFVIWNGAYGFHGLLKLCTGIVSCYTAYKVYSSIPAALQLPSVDKIKKTIEKTNKDTIETIVREHEHRQNEILRESTDSAHVGILVISGNGIITVANKSVCSIFGYHKSELENQHINMLVDPDFRDDHTSLMTKFINSDEMTREMAMNRIVTGFHKSGARVPLEIRLTRAQHDRETIYVSLQDVSERLRYEHELAATVSVTNNVLTQIPMGVRLYKLQDDVLTFVQQNAAADKILARYNTEPFLTEQTLKSKMILAAETETTVFKTEFILSAGEQNNLQLYLFNTSPGRMAVMFENVTAQKEYEGLLIERESIIRRAINASIAGVYIFDVKERKNHFVNDRYTAITGYDINAINDLENGISSVIHPDDFDKVINHFHHLLNDADDNSVYTVQYRVRHANGNWLWLMVQDLVFERGPSGKAAQLIGSLLDITPLKRMQDNLLSLKEKAEYANQSKSQFLANMSHEIRTPMNAVIALTDMVLKMEMGNKQREYLKKVQNSSRSLLQILNDVLDYSKLEAGKFEISNEPFDLYKMISNSLHLFSTTAGQKGLLMACDVDFDVPRFVKGDPTRIAQIINNLLGNAIKFTERGSVALNVTSQKSSISGAFQISFEIADTGIGIDKKKLQLLFQSFSQADSSIGRRFGGTGLGLSISRHLATLLNGTLSVDSEPQEGSRFTLTIPMIQEASMQSVLDSKLASKTILMIGEKNEHTLIVAQFFSLLNASMTVDTDPTTLNNISDNWDIVVIDTTVLANKERTRLVEHLLSNSSSNIRDGIIFIGSEGYYHEHASEIILNTASSWLLTPFILSDLEDCVVNIFERKNTLKNPHNNSEQLQFKDATVLLVEDHPTNQFVALELLNAAGLNVEVAEDGFEALHKFQRQTFDLVLMDLQMPNMDGFTAAQRIRALPVGRTVPIYAMSAAVMESDKGRVTSVGMDGHIAKPVVREDLYHLLRKVLAKKVLTQNELPAMNQQPAVSDTALRRALATSLISFELDVAISRLGDDASTYLSLLENFYLHFADFAQQLSQAENQEVLARRLHTMKGMSMSLGALRLETIVKEAEHLLHAGRLTTTREIEQEFTSAYRSVERALKACRPLMKNALADSVKGDLTDLKERVEKHQYLRLTDVEPYRSILETTYGIDHGERIISAIINLDYKEAIKMMAIEEDQ